MKILRTLGRIALGFVVAVIVSGLAIVAFIVPPAEIADVPSASLLERLASAATLALIAATHSAMFAGLTLTGPLTIALGEWQRIRSWIYYALVGMAIAFAGFFVQYSSEVAGQPTIVNTYALVAMLTAGLCGGLAYWLIAGRRAGGHAPRLSFNNPLRRSAARETPAVAPATSSPENLAREAEAVDIVAAPQKTEDSSEDFEAELADPARKS